MGQRGPRAKPTALKVARGNPGRRAVNEEEPDLPAPVAGSEEPPAHLSKRAKQEWRRLYTTLTDSGVLTEGDLDTFGTYCAIVGDCADYEAKVTKVGLEDALKLGYAGMVLKLRAQKKQYAAELGLTPASRSGVNSAKGAGAPGASRLARFGIITGGAKSG